MISIEHLKSALEAVPTVRLAVLFGSAAKRRLRSGSDLDIGVLLGHGVYKSPTLQVTIERAVGRRTDVIWLDEAPPLLRFEIARDGIVLVEREPHCWAEFRAHAMIDWWDWAPTARMMHAVMLERLEREAGRGPS